MKTKVISQDERILKHLQSHKSITSLEAVKLYGITRLSAVIFRLRRKGHRIDTYTIHPVNRYGQKGNCGEYHLIEGDDK